MTYKPRNRSEPRGKSPRRPLFHVGLHRAWEYDARHVWRFSLIVGPYPREEQREGELIRAMIHVTIVFNLEKPLRSWWSIWTPRRDAIEPQRWGK